MSRRRWGGRQLAALAHRVCLWWPTGPSFRPNLMRCGSGRRRTLAKATRSRRPAGGCRADELLLIGAARAACPVRRRLQHPGQLTRAIFLFH